MRDPSPTPTARWLHLIWNTKGSWLHGDPRGFRSRDHRIHSSGNYKDPPHPNEHRHLLTWSQGKLQGAVLIPRNLRPLNSSEIVRACDAQPVTPLALSVCSSHVHLLVGVPRVWNFDRKLVGTCKLLSSRAVRDALPGAIWSRGHAVVPVLTRSHQRATFRYITQRQEGGSYVWDPWRGGTFLPGKHPRLAPRRP